MTISEHTRELTQEALDLLEECRLFAETDTIPIEHFMRFADHAEREAKKNIADHLSNAIVESDLAVPFITKKSSEDERVSAILGLRVAIVPAEVYERLSELVWNLIKEMEREGPPLTLRDRG